MPISTQSERISTAPEKIDGRLPAAQKVLPVEKELEIVPLLCRSSRISADIGAYEGRYTRAMSAYSGLVHAFEPVPSRCEALRRRRFVTNANVEVHQIALSDHAGEAILNIPHLRNRFHPDYALHAMGSLHRSVHDLFAAASRMYLYEERVSVRTCTLDSFRLERLGFLKIDVEGHELAVLRGAMQSIRRSLPNILVEIEERHNPGGHGLVERMLGKLGYRGYFIDGWSLRPYSEFDLARMQTLPLKATRNQLSPQIPGYINNFLFLPPQGDSADLLQALQRRLRQVSDF